MSLCLCSCTSIGKYQKTLLFVSRSVLGVRKTQVVHCKSGGCFLTRNLISSIKMIEYELESVEHLHTAEYKYHSRQFRSKLQ
jgi:hypothetical protein